jgi:hypothetical protein
MVVFFSSLLLNKRPVTVNFPLSRLNTHENSTVPEVFKILAVSESLKKSQFVSTFASWSNVIDKQAFQSGTTSSNGQ